ncbi:hypothetical protein [Methanohalophilus profundi]|uniref:hypothetical protein n=1 Tax=Methanohalophilus profundi TaxID=2138083 RepID=UPI00101CA591|nr:hypothetical protein [Methanohalophilus profundi]
MYINGATIDAGTEITANLNQENYTLFVDGVEIIDEDDTLIYEPIGEENVDGDPSYGEVEAK